MCVKGENLSQPSRRGKPNIPHALRETPIFSAASGSAGRTCKIPPFAGGDPLSTVIAHSAAQPLEADAVIVGAGPAGLFQVFELGLLGIKAHIVDTLKHPGGQCAELYPDKPIYDIPALPVCGAQELVDRLMEQIKPFGPEFHLVEEVVELQVREDGRFDLATSAGTRFVAKAVVIAAGLGSFQPRRLGVEGAEAFE